MKEQSVLLNQDGLKIVNYESYGKIDKKMNTTLDNMIYIVDSKNKTCVDITNCTR